MQLLTKPAGEITTLLEALTGTNRVDAESALKAIADAIDTELGATTWRTGGGGGGTGTPVATQDEGTEIEDETTVYNFVGPGVTATMLSTGW